jgi:hypothetical protein
MRLVVEGDASSVARLGNGEARGFFIFGPSP